MKRFNLCSFRSFQFYSCGLLTGVPLLQAKKKDQYKQTKSTKVPVHTPNMSGDPKLKRRLDNPSGEMVVGVDREGATYSIAYGDLRPLKTSRCGGYMELATPGDGCLRAMQTLLHGGRRTRTSQKSAPILYATTNPSNPRHAAYYAGEFLVVRRGETPVPLMAICPGTTGQLETLWSTNGEFVGVVYGCRMSVFKVTEDKLKAHAEFKVPFYGYLHQIRADGGAIACKDPFDRVWISDGANTRCIECKPNTVTSLRSTFDGSMLCISAGGVRFEAFDPTATKTTKAVNDAVSAHSSRWVDDLGGVIAGFLLGVQCDFN
jgi:hypothetical protein